MSEEIENWGVFSVKQVSINVKTTVRDGKICYNPTITFILNCEGGQKGITVMTDHFCHDPKFSVYETLNLGLLASFQNINATSAIWDEDSKIIEYFNLNEDLKEYDEDIVEQMESSTIASVMYEKKMLNPTLH